jgi:molybdopterin-containing oxidoreductase family iron-sulfur binding subunit
MAAYGQPLDLHYVLEACDVVVSFDDDYLGPGPNQVRNAIGWASSRRRYADRPGIFLYCAESMPSATGAVAGKRLIADASRMAALAEVLANRLGVPGTTQRELTSAEQDWVESSAKACSNAGERSLLTSSPFGDASTAIWVARGNDALKSGGRCLKFSQPVTGPQDAGSLKELVRDMHAGKVKTLVIVNCNPAYAASGSLGFTDALKRVQSTLHLGLHRDETGALCEWQLPLTHELESWGDARAVDGTASIVQPTITPFYDVRSIHQIMAMLLGEIDPPADAVVRETWQAAFGADFDKRWKQALRDGLVEGAAQPVDATAVSVSEAVTTVAGKGLDIVLRPDPTVWDGRFSNVGWLQELPKPMTTLTWGNVVSISPALAKRLAVGNGDHVEVTIGDRNVVGPACIMPGQAENTVALFLGYGRRRAGRVGDGLGYDAYGVRSVDQPWLANGSLRKTSTTERLAVTQLHHRMQGFDFVREVGPMIRLCRRPQRLRACIRHGRLQKMRGAW